MPCLMPERLLVRDEGLLTVSLVNPASGEVAWQVPVPPGRNLFLLDDRRFIVGVESGFETRWIESGATIAMCADFPGTLAVALTADGALVLSSIETNGSPAVHLKKLGARAQVVAETVVKGIAYARIVTPLTNGGYLITSNRQVLEVSADGSRVWQATIAGHQEPHCWQALRLEDGNTLVTCGYAADLQLFDPAGRLVGRFSAPAAVRPFFFAGLQRLSSGRYLVANWQGHGREQGALGLQVLLFDQNLSLLDTWHQNPACFSSVQGVAAASSD